MNSPLVHAFIVRHKLAVISTANKDGNPEAALIGIAVCPDLDLVFDTVKTSRKYKNLIENPQVALVMGWDNEITVQYEGEVTELGAGDEQYKEIYFAAFADGRERAETWPDIVHFKVTPKWIRYSDFNEGQEIIEFEF